MPKKTFYILLCIAILFPALGDGAKKNNNKKEKKQALQVEIDRLNDRIDELDDRVDKIKKELDKTSALELSGFFDVSVSNYKNKPNVFALGDFELHLEHNYKEHFQVAAALVFNQGAELRVGFIDYHLFGSPISLRGRLFSDVGLHLQVGKFDVPFGNDYNYFLANDRITVTPPITTELLMEEGYNDEGIRLLYNAIWFNLSLYMLDGIEQKYSYGGNSYGGRIGFTPFNNPFRVKARTIPIFEIGYSYILDIDSEGKTSEKVTAYDLESKISALILRAEYYYRDKLAGVVFDGYHVTGGIDFDEFSPLPVILYGRYGYFRMKNFVPETYIDVSDYGLGREDIISRYTVGLNINMYDISFLKLEYQQFIEAYEEYRDQYFSESLYYAQLVITF